MRHKIMHVISLLWIALLVGSASSVQAKVTQGLSEVMASPNLIKGGIVISAPAIAENGAIVGIVIESVELPPEVSVREIVIYNSLRNEAVARYRIGQGMIVDGLKMRIRLAKTATVTAVAHLSNGEMRYTSQEIKVTIGGCGGGGPSAYYNPTGYNLGTERYGKIVGNKIIAVAEEPLSTFSIDVDTAAYSNVRRFILQEGRLPPKDAVRIEEMVNYFNYAYPQPVNERTPFEVYTEVAPSPWHKDKHLVLVGLQAYAPAAEQRPPANLVFLVDVSGSMATPNKLGILKSALKMLTLQLRPDDRVTLVTYAGVSGVALPPTAGNQKGKILAAIDGLAAGGSTNGAGGIETAYRLAQQHFRQGGINRVLLVTDGDFNVGVTRHDSLIDLIEQKRRSGVFLTVMGVGTGNLNDHMMEQLANHGNGQYVYFDRLSEARRVLVEQINGTLLTLAKDVKVQMEFNPARVAEYRLIGYENRLLDKKDFNDDQVDAGELGAGHSVTALYEITLADSPAVRHQPLRYGTPQVTASRDLTAELGRVSLRYKKPDGKVSSRVDHVIDETRMQASFDRATDRLRLAAAVAALGERLRESVHVADYSWQSIITLVEQTQAAGTVSERAELIDILRNLQSLEQTARRAG